MVENNQKTSQRNWECKTRAMTRQNNDDEGGSGGDNDKIGDGGDNNDDCERGSGSSDVESEAAGDDEAMKAEAAIPMKAEVGVNDRDKKWTNGETAGQ